MTELCEQFRIFHHNSTPYRPKMRSYRTHYMDTVPPYEHPQGQPHTRWVLAEAELDETEWVQQRFDQLNLIEEKRLTALCHGQLYQQRIKRAFDKKVKPRVFQKGDMVLKKVLPNIKDQRGKWAPNYEGPYMVKQAFSKAALILTNADSQDLKYPVNVDSVRMSYP
ncbi:hypothetical protein CR513_33325, partial [Mucuna pruriens]